MARLIFLISLLASQIAKGRGQQDMCCSWDYKNCGGGWCDKSQYNCESGCGGVYVLANQDCTAQWEYCSFDDNDNINCCPGTNCRIQAWGYGMCSDQGPATLPMPTSIRVRLHGFNEDYLNRAADSNGQPSSLVYLSGYNDWWDSMQWTLEHVENGPTFQYRIRNAWGPNSGLLQRDPNANGLPGSTLSVQTKSWQSDQHWVFVDQGNGQYQIVNQWDFEGGYLTRGSSGLELQSEDSNDPTRQLWFVSLADANETPAPTNLPTPLPSKAPTAPPTQAPSPFPTKSPTPQPTNSGVPPTNEPTPLPTPFPSPSPTPLPTHVATTPQPTNLPTMQPTKSPTNMPTPLPTSFSTSESTWLTIDSENFESGWGIWNDGGSDARRNINDAQWAPEGQYAIRLRDDSATSYLTSDVLNVESYTQVTMSFAFHVRSFEKNEYFFVEYASDSSVWTTLKSYVNNVNMTNGETKYGEMVAIDTSNMNSLTLRFHCEASGNFDYIYVDMITISGLKQGNPAPPTPTPTRFPTVQPTPDPTTVATTKSPTNAPTSPPTNPPSPSPTVLVTPNPTPAPTPAPSPSSTDPIYPVLPETEVRFHTESSSTPNTYISRSGTQSPPDSGNWIPSTSLFVYTLEPNWGSQRWTFEHVDSNRYHIRNSWSDNADYLTVGANGLDVEIVALVPTLNQIWNVLPVGNGYFKVVGNGGLVLAQDGYNAHLEASEQGRGSQNWRIVDLDGNPVLPVAPPAPTPPPTPVPIGSFPPGPYISTNNNSERITLRVPNEPILVRNDAACPHLQTGLLSFHDPATWQSGSLPTANQDVALPANTKVLISQDIEEQLGVITIPASSELIIGENVGGISLNVVGMNVLGNLTAGVPGCRIQTPISITLHGARPTNAVQSPPAATFKGISVNGGILNLHGERYFHTWTRLALTVNPGDQVLMLQDQVNWQPGQHVLLVTTAIKDSIEWHQNEVVVIQQVIVNPVPRVGAAVYLQQGVQYRHVANPGYQGEVGLLTRQIKVQGDSSSEPSDPDPLTCTSSQYYHWGDNSIPCPRRDLTGFGGHIMVHGGGKGYVDSVELFRMGQTNVLGRYPMHFHLLDQSCTDCYFRASSVHRSFYRCISIHGTHGTTVAENVAFDVRGYCMYLEDGVEENNEFLFNLVAHVHSILGGAAQEPPTGYGQTTPIYTFSNQVGQELTLPADVTASGFYITNVHNKLVGNAAVGGWAGFAFPNLPTALQSFRDPLFRPSTVTGLEMDSNTAHSTGWWWKSAGAFYFGGALYYENDVLTYNPGRSFNFGRDNRRTCAVNACLVHCEWGCQQWEERWLTLSNTKTFLVPGTGVNSWSGRMEFLGYESHDNGLSMESLSDGFWIHDMLSVCRTGESIALPPAASLSSMGGTGFFWYDTAQEHIVTHSTFRNCGYRSSDFDQYDTNPDRGCGSNECHSRSTVFGFLTHSDEHTPEVMQGTRDIIFESCGRRFYLSNFNGDNSPLTVSGRGQNWLDADGSISGFNVPTLIGSGVSEATSWWEVDNTNAAHDPQGPLTFIDQKGNDPNYSRALGHFRMSFDDALHNQVGGSLCGNGNLAPCPAVAYVKHLGGKFSNTLGLPVTANPDVVGVTGGYGWKLHFNNNKSPRTIVFSNIEAHPDSPMVLSISYPLGTSFSLTAQAASWCWETSDFSCQQSYSQVFSLREVRQGPGNVYYVDPTSGAITFRIVQLPETFTGRPEWFIPTFQDLGRDPRETAIGSFERDGVLLPKMTWSSRLVLQATCTSNDGTYCSGTAGSFDPDVCPQDGSSWEQTALDECCRVDNPSICTTANQW